MDVLELGEELVSTLGDGRVYTVEQDTNPPYRNPWNNFRCLHLEDCPEDTHIALPVWAMRDLISAVEALEDKVRDLERESRRSGCCCQRRREDND